MKHKNQLTPRSRFGFLQDSRFANNPALVILISFVLLILAGAILLTLPISSKTNEVTPFINALFTATSASCVTGLATYDTYEHFSIFGQVVIMLLIQLGGLGIVTLTSFFYLVIGKKMGLRTAHLARESVSSDEHLNTSHLIKTVMIATFCTELIGALLLLGVFVPEYGGYGVFMSVFFAVSAYCNAGFDLLGITQPGSSLITMQHHVGLNLTLCGLIIFGGLGFIVWQDLYNYRKKRKLMLHTKVVLLITGLLLLTGWIGTLLLEWDNPNTLGNMPVGQKILHGFVQSVTVRTAGFDSIGQAGMTKMGKLLSLMLMFIGAAPGSTAGGIKLTTFVVLLMTVLSVSRGENETVLFHRRIDKSVVYRSFTVMVMGAVLCCITAGVLIVTGSSESELDALFEAVSAFATVGLTVGPTANADTISKLVMIFTMLFGRVGPVAFALSLSIKGTTDRKKVLPEGRIWVG